MELIEIEMVAYIAAHATDEVPWRCMRCEKLTRHANEDIVAHLHGAHGLSAFQLRTEHDTMFLYPRKEKQMGSFTKNFRKRVVKTKLANSKRIIEFLMARCTELSDQRDAAKAKSPAADLMRRMQLIPHIVSCEPVKREESLDCIRS